VVVISARTLVQSAYSRDVENDADRYGADLVARSGGDGRALGRILERIDGQLEPSVTILRDHPVTKERIAHINAVAPERRGPPMLDAAEWAALKRICG
jgi:predicted Zn-dependent protease